MFEKTSLKHTPFNSNFLTNYCKKDCYIRFKDYKDTKDETRLLEQLHVKIFFPN